MQAIESAPKGGGAERTDDLAWVKPPKVLLLCEYGKRVVGAWYWCYAEGGNLYKAGESAWVEPMSGEKIIHHYDEPTHWMPLPEPPEDK